MADSSTNVPMATYDLIGTWIGQQRQAPGPLTDRLRSALVGLEHALQDESVSLVEPEMGETNWIGLLQEYRVAYPMNGSQEVLFIENSIDPTGRGTMRWKCQVSVAEAQGASFPPVDVNQPTFARKKDAKKYAAKCAVEWLRKEGFMPQSGAKFPKGMVTPHQQRLRQTQQQQQQPQPAQSKKQRPQAPSTPSSRSQPISSPVATTDNTAATPRSPFDVSQQSAVYQVSELCRDLGYPPPAYKMNGDGSGFFNGSADFGDHRDLLPFDAAAASPVRGGLGLKATKEMVAENLLVPLRAEKRKRDAENEAFMAQYAKGDKE
ncbi:hypothetical protein F5X97DRAFT_286952 [Nemania serpens]|nr:hypothetical protein F5X97DRAFT_286952 [Nemania serpens]